jgi:hypothetical protein
MVLDVHLELDHLIVEILILFGMVIVVFVFLGIGRLLGGCVLDVRVIRFGMEVIVDKEGEDRYRLLLVDFIC